MGTYSRYANIDCPVCGEPLDSETTGDVVVVCPDCGAPYHLECYKKSGQCIFTDLHEKNEDWVAPKKELEYNPQEEFRCPRCGAVNPSDGIACEVCGTQLRDRPLQENPEMPKMGGGFIPRSMPLNPFTTPFGGVSPDEEIDGIPAKDLAIFVGQNSHYFLPRFKVMSKVRSIVVNWAAFIFMGIYFLYRKMYALGTVIIIGTILLSIPSMLALIENANSVEALNTSTLDAALLGKLVTIASFISAFLRVFCGLFANKIYQKHAIKKIAKIKSDPKINSKEEYYSMLKKKGSVDTKLITGLIMAYSIGIFLMVFFALILGV